MGGSKKTSTSATFENASRLNGKSQSFEDTLDAIGGFGRFQGLALAVLLFPEIPAVFTLFIPVFVAKLPAISNCTLTFPTNLTSSTENTTGCVSEHTGNATSWSFSGESTIITEWDLTGSSASLPDAFNSIQMFGLLVGSIFTSQLSDWSGRKITYIFDCILMIFGQILSALAWCPAIYGFARFIAGIGVSGFMGMATVYPMEFMTPKWRLLCSSVGPWGEGLMLLAILAYYVRNWRLLLLLSTIPFITTLAVLWLPESPKWLLRNGKLPEAKTTLMRIAKINGIKDFVLDNATLQTMAETEAQGSSKSKFSYLSFFKITELRTKTVILIGIWFAYALVYYGLNYNVKNMHGDLYRNVFLMGLADAIGYPLSLSFNNRFGRRKSLIGFMCWAAFLLVVLAALDLVYILDDLVVAGICLIAKIGFAGARSSLRLLTGESYATPIRTMAFGISGMGAGIGGIICPMIVYLGTTWWSGMPFLFFAILSVLGSVLCLMLPETAGKVLQEQMGTHQ